MRFRDKVVVITGGGSGIGAATARRSQQEGAVVVIADRSEAARFLQAVVAPLRAEDPSARPADGL